MVTRTVVAVVIALCATARADKRPSAAAAKTAANAWAKAMRETNGGKDLTKVEAMLADNLHVVVVKDQALTCEVTAADRTKLPDALKCALDSSAVYRGWRPWAKKDAEKLWDPLRDHADEITALAKTDRVFIHDEQGEGMYVLAVIAVGVGLDKKPRIDAVYAAELYN